MTFSDTSMTYAIINLTLIVGACFSMLNMIVDPHGKQS